VNALLLGVHLFKLLSRLFLPTPPEVQGPGARGLGDI